ncbi:MAG: acetyl-CoA C-acyltransferase, partial [Methylobacterium sp.]
MADAFVYDHVRTPRGKGKADGSLHEVTAVCLAETALRAIATRNKLEKGSVEDVILGCVDPVGEASGDIARSAAIAADYGFQVPGIQINRFC